jgi:hypothetical protein
MRHWPQFLEKMDTYLEAQGIRFKFLWGLLISDLVNFPRERFHFFPRPQLPEIWEPVEKETRKSQHLLLFKYSYLFRRVFQNNEYYSCPSLHSRFLYNFI